ncbi:MAG: hypothetical protein WCP87_07315, partial [Atribacterota bacterium]
LTGGGPGIPSDNEHNETGKEELSGPAMTNMTNMTNVSIKSSRENTSQEVTELNVIFVIFVMDSELDQAFESPVVPRPALPASDSVPDPPPPDTVIDDDTGFIPFPPPAKKEMTI